MQFKDFYPDSLAGVIIKTVDKLAVETLKGLEKYRTISEMKSISDANVNLVLTFQPNNKPRVIFELIVCSTICWYEGACIIFTGKVKSVKAGTENMTPDKDLAFQFDYLPNQYHYSLLHLYYDE